MSDASVAVPDEVIAREPALVPRYDSMPGTLVLVTEKKGPIVEFGGPEGETRRRPALATVKVERSAIGRPVELMFVEGDLDRPVITKVAHVIDVQAELRARWDQLARRALGLEPDPRKLSDLLHELAVFVCVVAWFETQGNITHAAQRLRTTRRTLREHLKVWKEQNPRVVPEPPADPWRAEPSARQSKARPPGVQAQVLEDGAE